VQHIAGPEKMVAAAHAVVLLRIGKSDPDHAMRNRQHTWLGGPQGQGPAVAKLPAARDRIRAGKGLQFMGCVLVHAVSPEGKSR
jgi:hypothetical protein